MITPIVIWKSSPHYNSHLGKILTFWAEWLRVQVMIRAARFCSFIASVSPNSSTTKQQSSNWGFVQAEYTLSAILHEINALAHLCTPIANKFFLNLMNISYEYNHERCLSICTPKDFTTSRILIYSYIFILCGVYSLLWYYYLKFSLG